MEQSLKKTIQGVIATIVSVALCFTLNAPCPAYAATPSIDDIIDSWSGGGYGQTHLQDSEAVKALKGWVAQGAWKYYYRNGKKLTGQQKIGKDYYYFDAKGRMATGKVKAGGKVMYLSGTGKMEAFTKKGKYYKPNGKAMASYEAKDYKALQSARARLKSLTRLGMSKAQKLRACYNWIQKAPYHIYHRFKNVYGWTSDFANDHFVRKFRGSRHSDCNADAAALAYFAVAIGYKDVRLCVSAKKHGFVRIDGKYYDPYYAKTRSMGKYYGVSHGWSKKWAARIMVPSGDNNFTMVKYIGKKPASTKAKKSKKSGLVKEKAGYVYYSKGKKITSKWKTVGSAKYYFNSKGVAVTGAAAIKGKHYVFSAKGKLLTGTGTREVKVSGDTYRVNAKGVAVPGWSTRESNKILFLRNGRMATGVSVFNDEIYLFDKTGAYNEAKTSELRTLLASTEDASAALGLLGTPVKTWEDDSCHPLVETYGSGKDAAFVYKNAQLVFFRCPDGRIILEYFDYND